MRRASPSGGSIFTTCAPLSASIIPASDAAMLPEPSSTTFRPSQIGAGMWPPFVRCTTAPMLEPTATRVPGPRPADASPDTHGDEHWRRTLARTSDRRSDEIHGASSLAQRGLIAPVSDAAERDTATRRAEYARSERPRRRSHPAPQRATNSQVRARMPSIRMSRPNSMKSCVAGVRNDRIVVGHAGLLAFGGTEPVFHAHEPEHERVIGGVGELGVVLVQPGAAKDVEIRLVVLPHPRGERAAPTGTRRARDRRSAGRRGRTRCA